MSPEQDEPSRRTAWEEVRCSISVASNTVTAAEIARLVGVAPTRQRTKGDAISDKRPNTRVASHLWIWRPDDSVAPSLEAQLDAIWGALGQYAQAFSALPEEVKVRLALWIVHRGDDLRLGWGLDRRYVAYAAAFGASLDVDEYDATGD